MTEDEQDGFLAEWLLDGYEAEKGRAAYGWALSAVQKVNPRGSYRTAWKVFDAWGVERPPRQAAAAPPELITSIIAAALLLNRPQHSTVMLLCYAGLLRVRESLQLLHGDLVVSWDSVTLCLGRTKRGMEQKVVLRNPGVISWIHQFLRRFPAVDPSQPVFAVSYASVLRWVKKLSNLIGGPDVLLTTHSFRRSGASELARQGIPLADILLFGRWLRERSAREYIRRGEVAVLRAKNSFDVRQQTRLQRWSAIGQQAWALHDALYVHSDTLPRISRLNQARFDLFEQHVMNLRS